MPHRPDLLTTPTRRHGPIRWPALARVLGAASTMLALYAGPATANISLAQCDPNGSTVNARLPIGDATHDGFSYRNALYQFLGATLPSDVAYPAFWPPANSSFTENRAYWQSAAIPYTPYTYQFGIGTLDINGQLPPQNIYQTHCLSQWTGGLSPGQQADIEQEFLHSLLPEIGHGVVRRLMLDPSVFLLANIEDKPNCVARVPSLLNIPSLTFLAQMEYEGNAFLGVQPQLMRRFAINAALLLIQIDWATWNGTVTATQPLTMPYPAPGQSPFNETFLHPGPPGANNYQLGAGIGLITADDFGDRLLFIARSVEWAMQAQPAWWTPGLEAAFQEGIARAAERLTRMNVLGGQINRYYQSVHALAAAKRVLAGSQWQTDAAQWHDFALARFVTNFQPAGYHTDDAGRYDAGYNLLNLRHVVRALLDDPGSHQADLLDMAQRLGDLEAHLVLTDRTGLHTSPSAMSVRTGRGVAGRSYKVAAVDYALNYLTAVAFGVPFAYARARDLKRMGPYDEEVTIASVDARSSNLSYYGQLVCRSHPNHDPFAWKPQMALLPINAQTEDHISGAYRQYSRPWHEVEHYDASNGSPLRAFADTLDQTPSSRWLPFEQPGPYLRSFEDEFVFAKFGGSGVYFEGRAFAAGTTYDEYQAATARDYAAIVHLGPVGTNHEACGGTEDLPGGYGGGQLAALWAPGGGIFSLTRRKGYNTACDSWLNDEWTTLPIHAVTLLDAGDRIVSSARITRPNAYAGFAALGSLGALGQDFIDHGASALAGIPLVPATAANTAFLEAEETFSDQRYRASDGTLVNDPVPMGYRRRFVLGEAGVHVRTELIQLTTTIMPTARIATEGGKPKGQIEYPVEMPKVRQAWESIPLSLATGDTATGWIESEITVITAGGAEIAVPPPTGGALTQAYTNIEAVRLQRADGEMIVTFTAPQTVAFSEDYQTFGGDTPSRNLMVDLTPSRVSSANAGGGLQQIDQLVPMALEYTIGFLQ